MKEKVYCKNCKHYEHSFRGACNAPQNLSDSWYEPNCKYDFIPQYKNRKNNCEWYEVLNNEN